MTERSQAMKVLDGSLAHCDGQIVVQGESGGLIACLG